MLTHLTIHNYAIVDSLEVELNEGMTVITGETGAGKSIMLDALGLTLGDRADREVIRPGADRADITACFDVTENPGASTWLKNHDFSSEDNECLLRRVITSEGRSRAYINGQQTTLNELKDLGQLLIDIHSQHEHQSLLRVETHQKLVDEYGKASELSERVRFLAREWSHLNEKIEDIKKRSSEHFAQVELLTYQVKELDELDLKEGQLQALEQEHERLNHAGETLQMTQQLESLCSSGEDYNLQHAISQALSLARQIPVKGKHLTEVIGLLENAEIQIDEASHSLQRAMDEVEQDPERLQELDDRLSAIHHLARKHRVAPAELPAYHEQLTGRLSKLSGEGGSVEEMEGRLDSLNTEYQKLATELSELRKKASAKLQKSITTVLQTLGMPDAKLEVRIRPTTSSTPAPQGLEQCGFIVSTNAGQPAQPLFKIVSGGELSRISLAIQVVTAQTSSLNSLVFDEVDVGIGGGVARIVGDLLRKLGEQGQVICVTHQPQVAGKGHQHLLVQKTSTKDSTTTRLKALNQDERVEEIARMLSGLTVSEQSLAHAREMLA